MSEINGQKPIGELPKSDDKDFFPDGTRIDFIDRDALKAQKRLVIDSKGHYPIYQQGPYFICRGCPEEHTFPIDFNTHTVKDGKIVKLDKPRKK